VLFDSRFPLLDRWVAYFDEHKTGVNKDVWKMVLKFVRAVGGDIARFDRAEAWPLVIEEFVDFLTQSQATSS